MIKFYFILFTSVHSQGAMISLAGHLPPKTPVIVVIAIKINFIIFKRGRNLLDIVIILYLLITFILFFYQKH